MDNLSVVIVLALALLGFGAWLLPRWRKERARRQARAQDEDSPKLVFGGTFTPRELWLGLNAWSSLIVGGLLMLYVVGQAWTELKPPPEALLEDIAVRCRGGQLDLANRSGEELKVEFVEAWVQGAEGSSQRVIRSSPLRQVVSDQGQARFHLTLPDCGGAGQPGPGRGCEGMQVKLHAQVVGGGAPDGHYGVWRCRL